MALKFLWNGIKDSSGRFFPCWYTYCNWIPGIDPETIGITAKRYERFSAEVRELFTVTNDTDSMTDYFDSDRIKIDPAHPLYPQAKAAYDAMQKHRRKMAEKRCAKYGLQPSW